MNSPQKNEEEEYAATGMLYTLYNIEIIDSL
jgi:hypothetical protein